MVWVCRLCSTNNDKKSKYCFVCDNKRPRLKNLALTRRSWTAREEAFHKEALRFYKELFISCLCLIGICLVGMIVVKAVDNDFQSVLDSLTAVLNNAQSVLTATVKDNLPAIGKELVDSPLTHIFKNFLQIMKWFGGNLKEFGLSFWEVLKVFGASMKPLWKMISATAKTWWGHCKGIWQIAKEAGLHFAETVKELIG